MGRRTPLLLLAIGALAFLAFLSTFLPASLLLRFLPRNVQVDGLTGTLWSGRAAAIRTGTATLGPMTWRCTARSLLLARLRCDLGLDMAPGHLDALLTLRPDRRIDISGLRGNAPLAGAAAFGAPRGWSGQLRFENVGLEVAAGSLQNLSGTIVAADLRAPNRPNDTLGSYAIELGEGFATPGVTGGRLRNLDGPLSLRGALRIEPRGRYLAEGEVAPLAGTPDDLLQALTFLGPPDSSGRHPFSLEGTF